MAKLTLTDVANILGNPSAAQTTINNNNALIEAALEKTLTRDGTTPNQLTADLDLNNNDILNAQSIETESLILNGAVVTPDELATLPPTIMLKAVYDPTGVEDDAFDSGNTVYLPTEAGAVATTVESKLFQFKTTKDFGAAADGVTNDNAEILAMGAALGYIVFAPGDHLVTTFTLNYPLYFLPGAAITGVAGQTITITNRIDSSKQHIFKGECTIRLQIVNPDGEDSKNAHISWWGVFPRGDSVEILTAAINRAMDAWEGQNREGTVEFDNGSYRIDGTIVVPRGVWLKGAGSRRTIFDLIGDGYTAFETGGDAARISGIQFEQPAGMVAARTGTLIDILHTGCFVDDVRMWNTRIGIRVQGSQAILSRISSTYNNVVLSLPGTATVWVQASGCVVNEVKVDGTTAGPESIILLGGGHASSISNTRVSDIMTSEDSIPVNILADTNDITGTVVNGVIGAGDAVAVVNVVTSGASTIQSLAMTNISGNSQPDALVRLSQGSSGAMRAVTIDNATIYGAGDGVVISQSAGTLESVTVGNGVNTLERTNPFVTSGTMTDVILPTWYQGLVVGGVIVTDPANGIRLPSYTGANIADITHAVNTANKAAGKLIFDTTNIRVMVAAGASAGATWRVCDNSATVTPV